MLAHSTNMELIWCILEFRGTNCVSFCCEIYNKIVCIDGTILYANFSISFLMAQIPCEVPVDPIETEAT